MSDDIEFTSRETPTIEDILDFGEEVHENNLDQYPGDEPPKRPAATLVDITVDIMMDLNQIASVNRVEDTPDIDDEEVGEIVTNGIVQLLVGVGALTSEYDTNVVEEYLEQKEMIEAIQDADSDEEAIRSLLDSEELAEMENGVAIGEDVTDDDYDGDTAGMFA